MTFIFRPPKRIKKAKTDSSQEVLDKLQNYLEDSTGEVQKILCGFWQDQQDAITYQELGAAILAGCLSEDILNLWRQDYSRLVTGKLQDVWKKAMEAGSRSPKIFEGLSFSFSTHEPYVISWIQSRGAAFVTSCMDGQKLAMQSLLSKKMTEKHTVDELARMIRPCIGLTEGQAKANARYYDNIVENLKKEHSRMKPESIRKKAGEAAQKYAERQHRQRATTIAQTECAFAYNQGADESVRQAQEGNLLGVVKKRWSTAGNENVCDICRALEGVEIDMGKEFDFKGRILFAGQKRMPPAHPRCACAIEYIETSPPVFGNIPAIDVSITQSDSFREYSDEEINSIAFKTETIASKYVSTESKWSGNMVITDDGVGDGTGHNVHYGKLWNCDIVTGHKTAPAVLLHEQLHARSDSHYPSIIYSRFQCIEEAAVQFMAVEICIAEGIEVISSGYDEKIDILRQLRGYLKDYGTDLEFAKALIEVPLPGRLGWLSEKLYATMRETAGVTVADYMELSKLLDSLY